MAETRKSVSPRRMPNSLGPNPMLNVSTLTPDRQSRPEVPQLMHQDHDPEQDQNPKYRL